MIFLLPSDILVNELTTSVQQMQQGTESCVLDEDPLAVSSEKSEKFASKPFYEFHNICQR